MPDLGEFDGQPVTEVAIAVRNAGDGLSEALKVAPRGFHLGEKVRVLMDTTVVKAQLVPVDADEPEGDLRLVAVLKAGDATIATGAQVDKMLARQREANEAAKGNVVIPGLSADDVLLEAHGNGDHASGLVAGCAACDEEVSLMEAGA